MELGKTKGSIDSKLNRVLDKLEEKKKDSKEKKFNFPWTFRMGMKPKIKKGFVLIFYIQANRVIDLMFKQVIDQEIRINDVPYRIPMDSIFLYKGKTPAVLLPSWALESVRVTEIYDHERDYAGVQKTILRNMKKEQLSGAPVKSGFGGGISPIIWILAAVALAYVGYSIYMGSQAPKA